MASTPLHFPSTAAATLLLLVMMPAASALVPGLSVGRMRASRDRDLSIRRGRSSNGPARSTTRLSLVVVDPTEALHHAHHLAHHDPSSALDALTSLALAKASSVPSGQSLAPLSETIQQSAQSGSILEVIPDMPSMPGGASRTGNAFLSESFRDVYNAATKAGPEYASISPDGGIVVPARELDLVARYADLLDRIPLVAATYALVDFFLINAEEDVAIAELLDEDEEVRAIMEVERRVVWRRILGLCLVVAATIAWSLISYHPVPFNEL